MKKNIILAVLLLAAYTVTAQYSDEARKSNHMLFFSVGPSFPVADFGSTNLDNENAGMAKVGYNMQLKYKYAPNSGLGITSSVFYANHKIDNSAFSADSSLSIDHWQYYGILVGPLLVLPVTEEVKVDLAAQVGAGNFNSPEVVYGHQTLMQGKWSWAVPIQLSADLRYAFSESASLLVSMDYFFAKPKYDFSGVTETVSQKTTTLQLNAGIGIRF